MNKAMYVTAYGAIDCDTKTINGIKIPQDVFLRACRLDVLYGRNRWEYVAKWMYFKELL